MYERLLGVAMGRQVSGHPRPLGTPPRQLVVPQEVEHPIVGSVYSLTYIKD